MVPTAEQTASNRQMMAGVCRLVGVLMFVFAGYTWIGQIEFGITYGIGMSGTGTGWLGQLVVMLWDATYWFPLALVLLGVVFWRSADRIARVLVRIPKQARCPGCDYSLESLTGLRCPECGIELSRNFRPRQNENDPAA